MPKCLEWIGHEPEVAKKNSSHIESEVKHEVPHTPNFGGLKFSRFLHIYIYQENIFH